MTPIHHDEYLLDRGVMLALRAFLAIQPKLEFTPESRPVFDELMEKTPPVEGATYEAATVGGVFGWWCRPAQASDGCAVVYFHGGAYVLGSAAAYRNFVGQIAERAKSSIFIVEYAFAPGRAFPSALHDAEAVYRSLADAGLSKLAIAGDSAGGGLALALLLAICNSLGEDSVVKPVAAVVMSPWADLALTGESIDSSAGSDPLLTREALEKASEIYLGSHDRRDPKASPLYGDFAAVPPVLFHVGEDEILLDDSQRVAQQIEAAGGVAELHTWAGMTHVFPSNLALQAAKDALESVGEFLRHYLQSDSFSS
jgi:monoterpene epsilon-lactone hydrolase